MVRQIRIAHGRPDLQPPVRKRLDLVERQAVDVDDMLRPLDVQLHQVEKRRPARYKSGVRPRSRSDGAERVFRSAKLERLHGLRLAADFLDGGDDAGVRPATADVAAHAFADISIVRPAGLLEQRDRRHDLAGGAIAALIGIVRGSRWSRYSVPLIRKLTSESVLAFRSASFVSV